MVPNINHFTFNILTCWDTHSEQGKMLTLTILMKHASMCDFLANYDLIIRIWDLLSSMWPQYSIVLSWSETTSQYFDLRIHHLKMINVGNKFMTNHHIFLNSKEANQEQRQTGETKNSILCEDRTHQWLRNKLKIHLKSKFVLVNMSLQTEFVLNSRSDWAVMLSSIFN